MSKLQTSYPFVIGIAMAALSGCRTPPQTNAAGLGKTESPVMEARPVKMVLRTRSSVEYATTKAGNRTFLIQTARWDDNSTCRSLAAVWLNETTPVEMIVVDNEIPKAPQVDNNPAPLVWDTVPALETFTFRATPTFVDATQVLSNPQEIAALPKCENGEIRALARVPAPTEVQRTIPSENETLAQKRVAEKVLSTANLVCISFREMPKKK